MNNVCISSQCRFLSGEKKRTFDQQMTAVIWTFGLSLNESPLNPFSSHSLIRVELFSLPAYKYWQHIRSPPNRRISSLIEGESKRFKLIVRVEPLCQPPTKALASIIIIVTDGSTEASYRIRNELSSLRLRLHILWRPDCSKPLGVYHPDQDYS